DGLDLALDQAHSVGQVILAGAVAVLELEQGRPELAPAEAIDARVDLADAAFFLEGVPLLDDLAKEPVAAADDPAVAGRIPEGCGQDRDGGARLPVRLEQPRDGLF